VSVSPIGPSPRPLVARVGEARLPLDGAEFTVVGYWDPVGRDEHLALVLGDVRGKRGLLVRVHSECLTGDVFGSRRCDCGDQLELALARIAEEGRGVVVYLRGHEGRGIGLLEKIRAYGLQDRGLDTVEANLQLGHPSDVRDYSAAGQILTELGVDGVRLLTNNPAKCADLEAAGIAVAERVPAAVPWRAENRVYLRTKRAKLGHLPAA
jgi:3,4-dihydroxy 2-butanone 4-phosphate synthase/GTP cyclohydrolase II